MDVRQAGLVNGLDFWISYGMGKSFSIAIIGLATSIPMVIKLREKSKNNRQRGTLDPPPGRGDFPLWLMEILWLLGMGIYVYIVHKFMVPNFPLQFY